MRVSIVTRLACRHYFFWVVYLLRVTLVFDFGILFDFDT
ncbi:hypothetical protein BAZMOX_16663_0 [methanotrophic endosymbiont of Bathymodiolus azoricus (Menez Gwen)]|nr:hypothetical protein BAZMOX_16663_0 [methanotrophic endosymbiont of Bathymodiolus azoricus (Menez Gwen)]